MKAKVEKGLCFHYDAKFSPGHCCQDRRLQVLLVHDDPQETDGLEIPSPLDLQEVGMEEVVELSLNSVVDLSTSKTMKLKGKIGYQEVIILIDCGATHTFISNKVV